MRNFEKRDFEEEKVGASRFLENREKVNISHFYRNIYFVIASGRKAIMRRSWILVSTN